MLCPVGLRIILIRIYVRVRVVSSVYDRYILYSYVRGVCMTCGQMKRLSFGALNYIYNYLYIKRRPTKQADRIVLQSDGIGNHENSCKDRPFCDALNRA